MVTTRCVVGDLVDASQHLDQLRARHDRVVQVVVGRDASDRTERGLAALPQELALGVVGRDAADARAVPARDLAHRVGLLRDPGCQPVDLHEQHRFGVARVAGADEVLDRARDPRVHHLERGRQDPRAR